MDMDEMQATNDETNTKHQTIQDKPTLSFTHHNEVATVYDHIPATRRKSLWFLTWSTLILVSIILSVISVFLRSTPSSSKSFLVPGLSHDLSNAIKNTFSGSTTPALASNGRTDQVQWDNYTLILHGQRVLV